MNTQFFVSALLAGIVGAVAPADVAPSGGVATDLTQATQGYTYFNRSGASWEQHEHELTQCIEYTAQTARPEPNMNTFRVIAAITDDGQGTVAANIENCMVARGWRVVRLSDEKGASLVGMDQTELSARLKPWIGADRPNGFVIRQWRNDAVWSETGRFGRGEPVSNWPSISRIATPNGVRELDLGMLGDDQFPDEQRPPAPSAPKSIKALAPGEAVIIVRLAAPLE